MSITSGFTTPLSDEVIIGSYFEQIQTGGSGTASSIQSNKNQNVVSTYVLVDTPGDIVYENQHGDLQFMKSVPAGLIPMSATRILFNATVRGTPRETTASIMTWMSGYKY